MGRIAASLHSLPDEQRFGAIADALKTDHAVPLYKATASAPAFLSGMHPARLAQLRQECLAIVAPEYVDWKLAWTPRATA